MQNSFRLLESPLIAVEPVESRENDYLETDKKLLEWSKEASKLYGLKHNYLGLKTNPGEIKNWLSNARGLMIETFKPFCLDGDTLTIYYSDKESCGAINLVGLYGYCLVE